MIWGLAVLELKLYTLFCNTIKYSFNCIKGNGINSISEEIIPIEFLVRNCERFMNTKCIYIFVSFLEIYATYTIKQNKIGNNFIQLPLYFVLFRLKHMYTFTVTGILYSHMAILQQNSQSCVEHFKMPNFQQCEHKTKFVAYKTSISA